MESAAEKLVSVSHIDQSAGLEALLSVNFTKDQIETLMPNVVRHLERSGYPQVVGLAVQVVKRFFAQSPSVAADSFEKWQGVHRLIATLGHKTPEVRVACLALLAQLCKVHLFLLAEFFERFAGFSLA
jgi:hypothetical protein